jgi:hypothetical protein
MKLEDIQEQFEFYNINTVDEKWKLVKETVPDLYELLEDIMNHHHHWLSDKPLQVLNRVVFAAALLAYKDNK